MNLLERYIRVAGPLSKAHRELHQLENDIKHYIRTHETSEFDESDLQFVRAKHEEVGGLIQQLTGGGMPVV